MGENAILHHCYHNLFYGSQRMADEERWNVKRDYGWAARDYYNEFFSGGSVPAYGKKAGSMVSLCYGKWFGPFVEKER